MTKIRNTKKGMAKKTLSISLAVAMLATSNVPVWAAEDLFTDSAEVVFTSEEEAPVIEDEFETPVAEDAITEKDIDVSGITLKVGDKDVKGKEVVYGSVLKVGGDILKADGNKLQNYSFGWRIAGSDTALYTNQVFDANPDYMSIVLAGGVWESTVGQTLELYIFRNDDAANIKNTTIATVKVVAPKFTGNIGLTSNAGARLDMKDGCYTVQYNGKTFAYGDITKSDNYLGISGITLDNGAGTITPAEIEKYYDVTTLNPATKAGDVLTIAVTPKDGAPYDGNFSVNVKVVERTYAGGDVVAELNAPLEYEYTGNSIAITADKFTVKEAPGKYADTTLPNDTIKVAYVDGSKLGENVAKVTLLDDKLVNFELVGVDEVTIDATGVNKVNIKKRDLKNTVVSLGKDGMPLHSVSEGTKAEDMANYLVFKDNNGHKLTLKNGVDYIYKVTEKGKSEEIKGSETLASQRNYTIHITAVKDKTCVNETSLDFSVYGSAISNEAWSNNAALYNDIYYTGTAIEPTEDEIGNVSLIGIKAGGSDLTEVAKISPEYYEIVKYNNNTNATTSTANKKPASVTIKITQGDFRDYVVEVPFNIHPLAISVDTVTVPDAVSINKDNATAADYNLQLVVTAKDKTGKIVKGLSADDYSVKYEFKNSNEVGQKIAATITSKNTNFVCGGNSKDGYIFKLAMPDTKWTKIVAKALTDSMVKVSPSSYTYTGADIVPEFVVMDGALVLYNKAEYGAEYGEYEVLGFDNSLNVGTGKVTVQGVEPRYSGKASATYEITPANTKDVKVVVKDQDYTGRQVRPRMTDVKVTLNGNDVTNQFELANEFGENIINKGTLTLKTKSNTKNFVGGNITVDFNIVKEVVNADLFVFDENGKNVTLSYDKSDDGIFADSFDFDGSAKEFATEKLENIKKIRGGLPNVGTKATADDFEIKYADNISGKYTGATDGKGNYWNVAYVYAVAKDGTGYSGDKTITLADGTVITGVVDYVEFAIKNVKFGLKNVTIKNGVYAGGLPVKPEVLVQINGNTLVEGKDYKLELHEKENNGNHFTNPTVNKIFTADVVGLGGYTGSKVTTLTWGIDKKDFADCDIKVTNGVVTVMNGYIPVPVTEYTYKENTDGTYTVTANKDSKNYTGAQTVIPEGQKPTDKPEAPYIKYVDVVGNKATVILSGDSKGAVGYDYVISTDRDCITNKDYDKVNKNKLATETTFTYTQQGVYYAYCHAWKRDENGKKIFSDWSNPYPFAVSAITPDTPVITSVKANGSTVTVTYTKAKNADGYDVVLGSEYATIADEKRPVKYGELVKKNIKGNTVTATFKNVPAGTYYAGLHAFNRTSEDGKKVFSPWSNIKTIKVK